MLNKGEVMKKIKIFKKKLIVRKIYIFLKVITMSVLSIFFKLMPIDNTKIVICSYYGKSFGDNPKYIVKELLKQEKKKRIVWLVKNIEEVRDEFPKEVILSKYSLINTVYHLSTAKVWIDNCRKHYWSLKRKNQIYIQTWHGNITFKNIEKSAQDVLSYNYLYEAKNDSKMADVFISSSDFTNDLYRRDFWYQGEILKVGSPRNDIIVLQDSYMKDMVREYFSIDKEKKICLYAPTFRVDGSLGAYNIDYSNLKIKLEEKFKGEWIILIRLHPNISYKSDKIIKYNKDILNATYYPDMQELLVAADVLITDYSSSIFDYAISRKPAFIYASDINQYLEDRSFTIKLTDTPFSIATNNLELNKIIENFNLSTYTINLEKFYNELGLIENGNASKEIVNYIQKVMEKRNEDIKR